MTRTTERAAALRLIAEWRECNCYLAAKMVYQRIVKPFPRVSPEAAALREIYALSCDGSMSVYERIDGINEIARGWK